MSPVLEPEALVFVGTCDLSGHVRGKGMPLQELEARAGRGVGIVPSAIMMSAFGPIHETPYGTAGDLALVPDPATLVDVHLDDHTAERFCLGDILTLDGAPWACCPRGFLRRAATALRDEAGLEVLAAFEQEFVLRGVADRAASYRLRAFREAAPFGGLLVAALRQAGVRPEGFMAEYGARQFEVTVGPKPALRAADEAVITRELIRAVAQRCAEPGANGPGAPAAATLAPMLAPDGIGNGTHIHLSLLDRDGRPAMCTPDGQALSATGRHFVAGVQHHLPALCALAAPSVASYYRLTPGRWAPTRTDLAWQDRGAALRVCPVFHGQAFQDRAFQGRAFQGRAFQGRAFQGRAAAPAPASTTTCARSQTAAPHPSPSPGSHPAAQFNVEFRPADATASPYMALGGLLWAGLDGVRRRLEHAGAAVALPGSLAAALAALEGSAAARGWMGDELMRAYLMLKASEQAALAGLEDTEICERYADAY